jgi:hypothetical protein
VEQEASFGPIWVYRGANFGRPLGEVDWTAEVGVPPEMSEPFTSSADETDLSMHAPEDDALHDRTPVTGEMDEHGESEPR